MTEYIDMALSNLVKHLYNTSGIGGNNRFLKKTIIHGCFDINFTFSPTVVPLNCAFKIFVMRRMFSWFILEVYCLIFIRFHNLVIKVQIRMFFSQPEFIFSLLYAIAYTTIVNCGY